MALACLCAITGASALAQSDVVTITGRTLPLVGGFGDVPEARSPLATTLVGTERLADAGARTLADLQRFDAAAADAYNAEGYWSALAVRGFVLDPRYNYRRDGLPINAETWLPLANKDRLELLKGTSGIQAGTSAPGGLANLVVKRPARELRDARLEWREDGSVEAATDLGGRFGQEGRFGWRLNVEAARLRSQTHAADGREHVLALAGEWRATPDTLLEAEVERSRRSQPSVPGFSLLGDTLPDAHAIDPRANLNNQAWSQPVVFDATTASLRWQQRLAGDWQLTLHGAVQRLRTDDRVAFPFGCTDALGNYYADRYCPDGTFDLYDYRSEDERRRIAALDLWLDGSARLAGTEHRLTVGLLATNGRDRFRRQAFNFVGTGSIAADVALPPDPTLTGESTDRDERSVELYARDRVQLAPAWRLWAGARLSRIERDSVRTDGSEPTSYAKDFVTPFAALTYQLNAGTLLYASAGEGVESEVVPNRARYTNAGQSLPALRSRQFEVGVKHAGARLDWSVIGFDIRRPQGTDECDAASTTCTRTLGTPARHRGIEASATWRGTGWDLQGGTQWLRARQGDLRPANVPERTARAQGSVALGPVAVQAAATYEGPRTVVPGESIELPGWTRWDAGLRWPVSSSAPGLTLRVGVDNLTDKRAWRESPYQFGHAYLFPLAPRTWRVSVAGAF